MCGCIQYFVCLCRCFTSQSTMFESFGVFICLPGLNQRYKQRIKRLAQGHNTVPLVSLKLATLRSQAKDNMSYMDLVVTKPVFGVSFKA